MMQKRNVFQLQFRKSSPHYFCQSTAGPLDTLPQPPAQGRIGCAELAELVSIFAGNPSALFLTEVKQKLHRYVTIAARSEPWSNSWFIAISI